MKRSGEGDQGGGGLRVSPWALGLGSDGTYFLALKYGLLGNPLINPMALFLLLWNVVLADGTFFLL